MIDNEVDQLRLLIPPYSEEYFDAIDENVKNLVANMEYAKALFTLEEVYDFIQKTDQTPRLCANLILRTVIHLVSIF